MRIEKEIAFKMLSRREDNFISFILHVFSKNYLKIYFLSGGGDIMLFNIAINSLKNNTTLKYVVNTLKKLQNAHRRSQHVRKVWDTFLVHT